MVKNSKMIGIGIGVFAVLLVIGIAGFASAAQFGNGQGLAVQNQARTYYEDHQGVMENIIENGTYQDLVNARTQDGVNYMPFVTSEDQFLQMQQNHQQMEQYMEENGIDAGNSTGPGFFGARMIGFANGFQRGFGGGYAHGYEGGCPMWG